VRRFIVESVALDDTHSSIFLDLIRFSIHCSRRRGGAYRGDVPRLVGGEEYTDSAFFVADGEEFSNFIVHDLPLSFSSTGS